MLEHELAMAPEYLPAPQAVALPLPAGQYEPAGHSFCVADVDPAGQ